MRRAIPREAGVGVCQHAKTVSMAIVQLYFRPSTDPAELVPAVDQHVYLDGQVDRMEHFRTDATGKIVEASGGRSHAVQLDERRTYHVVVSPTALAPAPAVSGGAAVQVVAGRIAVAPHIAIRITRDGVAGAAALACTLVVGSNRTPLRTSGTGWLVSNDRSSGAVSVISEAAVLSSAATATAPTLAVDPAAPVRGATASIRLQPPAGGGGVKVVRWQYEIAHTNPGKAESRVTVIRPGTESPTIFDSEWRGALCASGVARVRCTLGVQVRADGAAPVQTSLRALALLEATLTVTVQARTGPTWQAGVQQDPEQAMQRAINTFHDLGEHSFAPARGGRIGTSAPITIGPNRGCVYLESITAGFVSTPRINTDLTNASSNFSRAQDKAYLTSPAPIRVIPRNLYNIGLQGALQIPDENAFRQWVGQNVATTFTGHCITQADLLTGTRRHEHQDPQRSHRANCLKALRALEPAKFAEALVRVPGASLDFGTEVQARITAILSVGREHYVVDEDATRSANAIRQVGGEHIPDCNADANGTTIAPVWNPTAHRQLGN